MTKELELKSRAAWRRWLEKNHETAKEVTLVFARATTGAKTLPYADAVEEALCFGWIDGLVKGIDEERYSRRFTPRKPGSMWSDPNVERWNRLKREGKLAPAGLAAAPTHRRYLPRTSEVPPPQIEAELRKDEEVWSYFNSLPPSHRREYLRWFEMAKREETKTKRVAQAIGFLKRKEKLNKYRK